MGQDRDTEAAEVRSVSCIMRLSDDRISGIQDHFGKCYRGLYGEFQAGDIHKFEMHHNSKIGTSADDLSTPHVRILARVHVNTVRALVRRSKHPASSLIPRANWYEVISD